MKKYNGPSVYTGIKTYEETSSCVVLFSILFLFLNELINILKRNHQGGSFLQGGVFFSYHTPLNGG